MTRAVPPVPSVPAHDVLAAGGLAPSGHNTQPWILREDPAEPGCFEVRGDPERTLPVSDPDHRALRVVCGAALANMRLAVRARGRRTHAHLLPDPADPWSLARLRVGSALAPTDQEQVLAAAIPRRHSHRRAFAATPVSLAVRATLRRAAEAERAWAVWLDDPGLRRDAAALVGQAHRAQRADPDLRAEQRAWTGRPDGDPEGLGAGTAGPRPPAGDPWRVRDLTGGAGPPDRRDEALVLVLGTFHDQPLAHLQAGQALQRVLLTATAHGLAASFVAPPLEVPSIRGALRALLGGALWPQAMLRLGHGSDTVATPRRPVD